MPTKIASLEQIREACKTGRDNRANFIIALGKNGELRSSKEIFYGGKNKKGQDTYSVFHSIDGTIARYVGENLLTQTNIGKAIEVGRFYLE